jgi:uncharacterized membrane protein YdbT with pleckstrin-like domain
MQEQNVVYIARMHLIIFFWPALLLCLAAYFGYTYPQLTFPSMIVGLIAASWLLLIWATYHFSSLTIKRKQVILRTGILVRKTTDIPINKIESIDIRQSVLGSLLGFGSLVITGTGGTRQTINYINKPLTCRRYIEQLGNET